MPPATVQLNLRTEEAKKELQDAIADSMRELLRGPVKSEAERLCPRSEKLHKGQEKHTADTIAVRVRKTKKGIGGSIFTQSGRGAYIEAGTKHSAAHPFLFPALMHHARDLVSKVTLKVRSSRNKSEKISSISISRIDEALGQ